MEGVVSIYMAGKISRKDWRNSILNMRKHFEVDAHTPWPITRFNFGERRFKYMGPYFFSCDHGCYHGPNSHGWIKHPEHTCETLENNFLRLVSRKQYVTEHCMQAIRNAEVFFAWIEDETCFGTLAELGYAKALDKKIIVGVKKSVNLKNIWFTLALADVVVSAVSAEEAFRQSFAVLAEV